MAPFLPPAAALTVAPSSTRLFHLVSLSSRERHPPYSQPAVTTPRRPSSSNGPSNGQGRPTFLAPTRLPMSSIGELPTSSVDSASSPLPSSSHHASTSAVGLHRRSTSATFAWANFPNMTICASATVSWIYTGPDQELLFTSYPGHDLRSISVNATTQTHTFPVVRLMPGEYTMTARLSGSQDLEYGSYQTQFFVNGTDTSCLPLARRSHPIEVRAAATEVTSTSNGSLVAGIAVGVGGAVTLLAVGFYFRFAIMRLFRRRPTTRESDPEVPVNEGRWDTLHSRSISEGSYSHDSERRLLDPEKLGTPEMRVNALPTASQATFPRLEPNRRPPSNTLEVARSLSRPPLPRLEPNRRRPSIPNTAALEAASTAQLSEHPAPPLPAVLSTPKVDLEAEFKPISRPVPIAVAPILKMPKPPRRSTLRQSGTSAFTSASTTLSDMPLLRPSPYSPVQIELQRSFALAKLDAIMDYPPLPTATPPPPSRSPSPSLSSLATATAAPQVSASHHSPTSPNPRSPLTPFLQRMYTQQPLSRSGSGRSRIITRKPVPPLDPSATPAPSDIASSIIWTRRSSYASTYAWNGRESPVPSSSTSQMYRTRDSAWSGSLTGTSGSEWTWTRPVEEWEREQLRALAAVNAEIATDNTEVRRSGRATPSALGNSSFGAKGGVMRRNLSFGDMKAMKAVIPDLPPLTGRNVTQ
ncbi:hypothetical protein K466DRAFT_564255 [Polyporus arcularius HHB13444]|uniref:Uncharacterized protein n=1 Tax=Polyporus arcularius HHB13444 TaxID=1314778 RepID=A0A5C3PK04_9APHY|nr:hypothetical protein K466DRAFT_564255 [Polyporus arcularius HHB13444]